MNGGAVINLALGALIALLPLITRMSRFEGQEIHRANILFWSLIAFLALAGSAKRRAPWWMWGVYAFFGALSVWNQVEPKSMGVFIQASWVFVCGAFVVRLYETFDQKSEHFIFDGMVVGCLIQCVLCVLDRFGIHWGPMAAWIMGWAWQHGAQWNPTQEAVGSLGGTNWTSVYIALTAVGMFRPGRWYYLPLAFISSALCGAIMGGAALIGACLYWAWSTRRLNALAPYLATSLAFALGCVWGVVGKHQNGRFEAWAEMLRVFPKEGHLLGMGPGWFYDFFGRLKQFEAGFFHQEHNEFLACLFAFGAVGLLAMLALIAKAAMGSGNVLWKCVLFAAFVSFFGYFTMHQSTAAIVVLVALAASLAGNEEDKNGVNLAG